MVLLVVALLSLLVSVPLVHEAGHLLAALLVGGRRVTLARRGALTFVTQAELPERPLPRRAFYAAGPLANLAAAGLLVVAARALASEPASLVLVAGGALVHVAFALVNLLPLEGHDGHALLHPLDDELVDDERE